MTTNNELVEVAVYVGDEPPQGVEVDVYVGEEPEQGVEVDIYVCEECAAPMCG